MISCNFPFTFRLVVDTRNKIHGTIIGCIHIIGVQRTNSNIIISHGDKFKPINRGKLNEAEHVEDNNISHTFKVKNRPIILEEPSLEEDTLPDIVAVVVSPIVLPTFGVGNIDVASVSVNSLMQSKDQRIKGMEGSGKR